MQAQIEREMIGAFQKTGNWGPGWIVTMKMETKKVSKNTEMKYLASG